MRRLQAVPFRSVDRASLLRERKNQNQLGNTQRVRSEQTSREEPGGKAAGKGTAFSSVTDAFEFCGAPAPKNPIGS